MKNWTPNELKAYLLIYAMNADYVENALELEVIKSKIGTTTYDKMHKEFNMDNDYQSIQKINKAIEEQGYKKPQVKNLLNEIKEIFNADGDFDILERNLNLGLKRVLTY